MSDSDEIKSKIPSLTVQSLISLLTYDKLQELHNMLNQYTYYYLILDPCGEIATITDMSQTTKIKAVSVNELLNILFEDAKIIRLMISCSNNFFENAEELKEQIQQRYNLFYLNPITDEINAFVKEHVSKEMIIKGIKKMIDHNYILLFNHKLQLIKIQKNNNEYEFIIDDRASDLLSYAIQ